MVEGYLFSDDPLTMHIKHRQKKNACTLYETFLVMLVCLALYLFATRMVTGSEHFARQHSSVFQLSKLIISKGTGQTYYTRTGPTFRVWGFSKTPPIFYTFLLLDRGVATQYRHHLLTLSKGGAGRHRHLFCGLVDWWSRVVVFTTSLMEKRSLSIFIVNVVV